MKQIVLTTLNARFIHTAFGLRYLYANMGELQKQTRLIEFTISERPHEIVERLLQTNPAIIGLGVYIWNIRECVEVVGLLKKVAPEVTVIGGGPELSYETESSPLFPLLDYVITGEADLKFAELCRDIINGQNPGARIHHAKLPQPDELQMPYAFYGADDIENRVIYVEASRGCPFTCEFCLSSLDIPVRQFEIGPFLEVMDDLYRRGVRHFKFVDRTFNLNPRISSAILEFFLKRLVPDLFVHFEMVPDRLPESLRQLILQFPAGSLQFEIGVQTFNPEVSALISRRQDYGKVADNIAWLRDYTGVHLHVDLIAGLPGESLESFGNGFDRLIELGPQEIQVGILKRLRGTPIIRHDEEWGMVYSGTAPYELLCNKLLDFPLMQRLGRFSRFWDLVGNSGNFRDSCSLIWHGQQSPFKAFIRWCDWLYEHTRERHGFSLKRLTELLFHYLTEELGVEVSVAAQALVTDYTRKGAQDLPLSLKKFARSPNAGTVRPDAGAIPSRQQRHL